MAENNPEKKQSRAFLTLVDKRKLARLLAEYHSARGVTPKLYY
ncbi:hypothetical protein [uncultured Cedecea sp.]|nr:hypothetical protein [uncultured Cedecea sp.]